MPSCASDRPAIDRLVSRDRYPCCSGTPFVCGNWPPQPVHTGAPSSAHSGCSTLVRDWHLRHGALRINVAGNSIIGSGT